MPKKTTALAHLAIIHAIFALYSSGCQDSGAGQESSSDDASIVSDSGTGGQKHKPGPGEGYDFSDVEDQCGLDTGYPGDVLCLKPPTPDKGFQIHLGPSNYDDPKQVEPYLLQPQQEETKCMYFRTPNATTMAYYEREIHMRPISHHIFLWLVDESEAPPEAEMNTWHDCYGGGKFESQQGVIGGGESPITRLPAGGKYAPENVGIGRALPANKLVRFEMHAFNATDKPVLREAWANVYYMDKADVKQWVSDVGLYGGLSYATAPHTHEVMRNKLTVTDSSRWISIWGHGHSHLKRFSAWRNRGGERTVLLEDFDWQHPTTLVFDTITTNPAPDEMNKTVGGASGIVELQKGDTLEWECEVDNTTDHTLRYVNLVDGGEMCNLFGEYIGKGGGIGNAYLQGVATRLP
jgi:hypothetical protein